MAKNKAALTESQVVSLWLQRIQVDRSLTDTLGNPIQVIYPGRSSDIRGGDFRDALVESGGSFHSGNIEIHTLNGNWLTHGHHKDPLYNNVILHVAFQSDRAVPTTLQNGKVIPTVILDGLQPVSAVHTLPCSRFVIRQGKARLAAILNEYGLQRLEAKAVKFQVEMTSQPPEQVLYSGIFEALGYSKNQEAFRRLAAALPLTTLLALQNPGAEEAENISSLAACLLGSAGLLPSQRGLLVCGDETALAYEESWRRFAGKIPSVEHDWELFKVRPANSPLRRLVALACLAQRFSRVGWLESVLAPLIFSEAEKAAVRLIEIIEVNDGGYWSTHYDFGSGCRPAAILGPTRTDEIVINVVLPFALAWSRRQAYPLEDWIKQVYAGFPALQSNSIERHIRVQLGIEGRAGLKACGQQGLLQIYKFGCTRGGCDACKLAYPQHS
jgi:hypothetical protein